MKILAIETSCDETGIAIIEATKNKKETSIKVLGNQLLSQARLHEQYGGVFPTIAKREHALTLTKLLKICLKEASMLQDSKNKSIDSKIEAKIIKILEREGKLKSELIDFLKIIKKPKIDAVGVTCGPGLEPALWVGINFAKALSVAWDIPLYPINHMEGHILSSLLEHDTNMRMNANNANIKESDVHDTFLISNIQFPAIALLISGGHTELVLTKKIGNYKVIGETRDDAVGEAFDKVARMLGLPYPGGPQISKLAEEARNDQRKNVEKNLPNSASSQQKSTFIFPRPMIHSHDFDFSFSGLKTSVLYAIKKISNLTSNNKKEIAFAFEEAVGDVLAVKTLNAIKKYGARTLIIGGGVSANSHLRSVFANLIKTINEDKETDKVELFLPDPKMSTDNALMIALATYIKIFLKKKSSKSFKANGNLSL